MINKKILSSLFGITFLGLSLTGCMGDSDNEQVTQQSFTNCISVIFNANDDQPSYKIGVGYLIKHNYTTMTAAIDINSLSLGAYSFATLQFENLTWKQENGWKKIEVRNVHPVSGGVTTLFDELTLDIYDRIISTSASSTSYYPLTKINYAINGEQYYVVSMLPTLINTGETVVKMQDGTEYKQSDSDASVYYISLANDLTTDLNDDTKRLATIMIQGAKFASSMPAMNMQFANIPYTVNRSGRITMHSDSLIPSIVGSDGTTTPYESFPITNLDLVTDAANNMIFTFTCTTHIKKDDVEIVVPYDVTVTCAGPSL